MKRETFRLRFFPKAYFFNMDGKWLVIEKGWRVVCVYATGRKHDPVYAAIPLCAPKHLRNATIEIMTSDIDPDIVLVSAADIRVVIDYGRRICTFNRNTTSFGSDNWGQNCIVPWSKKYDAYFK